MISLIQKFVNKKRYVYVPNLQTEEEREDYRSEVMRRARWTVSSLVFSTIALIFNIIVLYKMLQ